jgi:AraC-like DNA-binding protein
MQTFRAATTALADNLLRVLRRKDGQIQDPTVLGLGPVPVPDEYLTEEDLLRRQAAVDARDLFFSRLFTGGYFLTEHELREAAEAVSVKFDHQNYLVVQTQLEPWGVISADGDQCIQNRRDMFFILRNVLQNAFDEPISCEAAVYGGQTVGVVNFDNDSPEMQEHLRQRLQYMVETLEGEFGLTVTAMVSRTYTSPMDIQKAYGDTCSINEYNQVINEDFQVVFYEDLTHRCLSPSETNYAQLEMKLLSCFQLQDYEGVREIMHQMISSEFEQTRPTIQVFRFRVYGLVNTMLYMLQDLRNTRGEGFQNRYDPGPRLAEAPTLNDFMLEMDKILDDLKAFTQQQKKEEAPTWVVQMEQFVKDNYTDVNITVSYVAEKFNMSPSYCSRVFKQHIGVRLFDFIQTQRLEAAKSLLDSSLSVKDIAEQVGFSSTLTMNRAFKRYEGTCPSKFRSA